jgi:acetyl-CoA acetyltransferase
MAVASGVAEVVVVYRSINGRSGLRYSRAMPLHGSEAAAAIGLNGPFGLVTPAQFMGMRARRYMHQSGATSEDFGRVAVVLRSNASTNPAAVFFGRPITLAEHQASRWISEPIRLLDCCLETDGAQAVIVTSAERARDLRHPPAVIRAASQGMVCPQELGASWSRDSITGMEEMRHVARRIYARADIGPDDIQTAILYDHFTPLVLMQLEALGFCDRGEGPAFVREGNIEQGGRLPINPHGGMIGEAYIHGINNIAEGVRQLRGTSGNQVPDVEHVLVTSGGGGPSSGAILGRDRG